MGTDGSSNRRQLEDSAHPNHTELRVGKASLWITPTALKPLSLNQSPALPASPGSRLLPHATAAARSVSPKQDGGGGGGASRGAARRPLALSGRCVTMAAVAAGNASEGRVRSV